MRLCRPALSASAFWGKHHVCWFRAEMKRGNTCSESDGERIWLSQPPTLESETAPKAQLTAAKSGSVRHVARTFGINFPKTSSIPTLADMYCCEKHAELHMPTVVCVVKAVFPECTRGNALQEECISPDRSQWQSVYILRLVRCLCMISVQAVWGNAYSPKKICPVNCSTSGRRR